MPGNQHLGKPEPDERIACALVAALKQAQFAAGDERLRHSVRKFPSRAGTSPRDRPRAGNRHRTIGAKAEHAPVRRLRLEPAERKQRAVGKSGERRQQGQRLEIGFFFLRLRPDCGSSPSKSLIRFPAACRLRRTLPGEAHRRRRRRENLPRAPARSRRSGARLALARPATRSSARILAGTITPAATLAGSCRRAGPCCRAWSCSRRRPGPGRAGCPRAVQCGEHDHRHEGEFRVPPHAREDLEASPSGSITSRTRRPGSLRCQVVKGFAAAAGEPDA